DAIHLTDFAARALALQSEELTFAGDYGRADTVARFAFELADRPMTDPLTRAQIYSTLGSTKYRRNELTPAADYLQRALDVYHASGRNLPALDLSIRLTLIEVKSVLDGHMPEELVKRTFAIASDSVPDTDTNYIVALTQLGLMYSEKEDHEKALP